MTGGELERAIDFLLKSGARADARIEQTNEQLAHSNAQLAQLTEQVAQLSARLDSFADTQAKIMKMMARRFDAPSQANASRRAADKATKLLLGRLIEAAERLSDSGR